MASPSNTQFQPILIGTQPIYDVVGDESPASTDIVGNTQFPAAFAAYDGTTIFFRIRLNADPRNSKNTGFSNFSWGVLINTSGNPGVYDWLANVNGLDNTINLIKNTTRVFNSWNDPAEGTDGSGTPTFSRPIVNFDVSRVTLTNDGSNFGGDADYFIDFQFPAADFFRVLGISPSSPLQFIIFSSANANNYNKDSLQTSEGFQFVNALTNPVSPKDVDVRANLTAAKTITSGPTSVFTGSLTTWTQSVTVTNSGRALARQVVVNDVFSLDQLSSVSSINTSTGTSVFNSNNTTLSWTIGNLAAGQTATLTYTVIGTFTTSGTRRLNTVTASGIDDFTGLQLTNATAFNNIEAAAAAAVTGKVTSGQTGLPLRGVTVELRNQNNVLITTTQTNAEGNYSFTQLASGTYTLNFIAANFVTATRTPTVPAGQTQIVNVTLQPSPGTVTGTVTSTGGTPVASATINLIDAFNTVVATATTNIQGQYTLSNVNPGQYSVTVSAPNFQSQLLGITVTSNQTTTANFTLIPSPGTVTGIVSNTNGTPIQGAIVEVLDTGNNVIATVTTNAQGQYTANQLAPGTFQLRVKAQNFQTTLLGFTVQASQTTTQNVILQPSPGTLTGAVNDAQTGVSLSGVSVNVVNQGGITVATATTNAQGQYSVTNLAPGSYTVTFGQPGFGSQTIGAIIQSNQTTTLNAALNRLVGVINGVVTSGQGGALAGAVVNVFLNNNLVASVTTDQAGAYVVPNLAPGSYTVTAIDQNFQSKVAGAQVVAFQTTTVNFSLTPDPGALTGTVTDSTGAAVAGATINVKTTVGGAIIGSGITDQNGVYTIPNLSAESYIVTATALNFQSSSQGTAIRSDQTTTLNFTLAFNPVTITGTVRNQQTGDSIAGAQIQVRILDTNGAVIATVFANSEGNFLVPQLAPGTYTLVVAAPNFQTNFATITVSPGGQANIDVSLAPNPGIITGQVVNGTTGDQIIGASVSVVNQSNVQVQVGFTDSQGIYMIEGLPPGNYHVVVNAANFQTNIAGGIVLADTTTVVNVSLPPEPGLIAGNVSPVQPNTVVALYSAKNVFIQSVLTDGSGNYQFSNLAPGNYILIASSPNFAVQSAGAIVSSNTATSVSFALIPNPSIISGVVTDTGGAAVPNASVQIFDANETILATAGTDANGAYSIGNLPPGSFSVLVTAPSFGHLTSGIILSPGSTLANINFALTPNPGAISGQVTDVATGAPLAGSTVVIRQAIGSGVAVATVTSDSSGNFLVQGLAPGSYTVTSSFPTFGTKTIGAIVSSDTTTTASIALNELAGSINGQLVDSTGTTITGSNLQVRLLDLNGVLIEALLAQSDGTFAFFNVFPGSYVLNASAPAFQATTIGIQVQADQQVQTSVILQPSPATLTGQVINQQTGIIIAGSIVSVLNPNTGLLIGRGASGQDGTFVIENLPAGSFVASAGAQDFGTDSRAVILSPGQTTTTTLTLTPNPGSVSGFVVNRNNGDTLAGASIQIFDQTGAPAVSVSANAQGQFLISGLAPGLYTAIAASGGYTSGTISFTVVSDTQAIASFALEPNPSTIQGTVTNVATGTVLSGTDVIIRQFNATGPIIATSVTDTNGLYAVSHLPQGTFTVIVVNELFGSQASSVTLAPGETAALNFALEQLPSAVQGTVTNAETGVPIINTLIQLIDANGILVTQTQTDINGFYQIAGFTAGDYTIPFTNPTFQSQTLSFTSQPNQTSVVNANLIASPGSITGQVLDAETASPLIGASIQVFPALGLNPIATLVTDGRGHYFLDGLAPGSYILIGSFQTYATSSTGVAVRSNETSSSTIFLVPTPATVSGTVRSDTGEPIINATVRILDQNEFVLGTIVTDEFGNYSLTDLPQGNQEIIVSAPGFATQLGGVILIPGQVVTNLNFILTANSGSISGQIVTADTEIPIVGAIAIVRTVAGVPFVVASTTTDELGNYKINGLQPGSYTVTGSATGYALNTVGAIVISDQMTQANIALSPLVGSISGTVLNVQGNPIVNIPTQIRVFSQNGGLLQTVAAQSDGTFSITNLPPGSYQLTVTAANYAANTVGAFVTANEMTVLTVPLTPNPGKVNGQVVSSTTGDAIFGSIVSVTDLNGLPIGSTVTDQNGNFSIPNLPPTTVIVSAVATNFGSDSRSVILTPGSTGTSLLTLAPNPGAVSGAVINQQTGAPLIGATMQIFDFTGALVATVLSDRDGLYQVQNLTPGFYQVIATSANFGTQVQNVQAASNVTSTVNLVLTPDAGLIFGTVVNQQTGALIVGASVVVRLFSPAGPVVQTTATDSSGQFTVLNLGPGAYAVTVFNPNFGTQSTTTFVQSDTVSTVSLALLPNPGAVQGLITSAQTGESALNTQINILSDAGILVATVQTDSNGNYFVPGLAPGTYTLVFSNPNFQSSTIGAIVGSDTVITVNTALTPDPGTITGTVIDSQTGLPIAGASVQIFPAQSLIPIASAITGQDGGYSVLGIQPGDYVVEATVSNYAVAAVGTAVFPNTTATAALLLSPNPAALSGTITSTNGTPIAGAAVRIIDQNETVLGTGVTDQNGHFTIGNLSPGSQIAVVSASEFGTQIIGVTLSPGQIITDFSAQLTPNSGNIQGQTANAQDGALIAGADIVIRKTGASSIIVANATTDVDGNYRVNDLTPGTYLVTASKSGFGTNTVGVTVVSDTIATANVPLTALAGVISGTIIDSQGNPITGNNIQIQVFDQNGHLIKSVLANSDGVFTVVDLPPGSYQLTFTAPNFTTGIFSATVTSEQTIVLVATLQPDPATVTTQVVSGETSEPIPGAIVTFTLPNGTIVGSGVTDTNGSVSILNLPPQTLNVSVTANNFGSLSQSVILTPGQVAQITIALSPEVGRLEGTVVNELTGELIAGATLKVFDFTRGIIATVMTDTFGFYEIQSLSSDLYRVIASAQGFGSTVQEAMVVANQQTVLEFFLPPDAGSIQGTVVNQQTGNPLASVSIIVRQFTPTGPIIAALSTDQNGIFTVNNLAPGTYTVVGLNPNFGSEAASTIVQSDNVSNILLALIPNPGTVQGQITNGQTGEGLTNSFARILDSNRVIIQEVQTDGTGNYQAEGLAPGDYVLIAVASDFQRETIGFSVVSDASTTVNVTLLPDPGRITGRVLDQQTGLALDGATVQLFPPQSLVPIANALTDQNGMFQMGGLAPGEYILVANARNYARGTVGTVVFSNQTTVSNIELQANFSTISGTVISINGTPIGNASVRVISQNETVLGTALTDQNGNYVISNLPPGAQTIVVNAPAFSNKLSGITLQPGDVLENINFSLNPNSGNITGQITNAQTGEAISSAIVVVRLVGGVGVIVANSITNENGTYFIGGLAPGTYTVVASGSGFASISVGAVVQSDETTLANISLIPSVGRINGTITDAGGSPILGMNTQIQVFDQSGTLLKTLLAQYDGTYDILDLLPGSYTLIITVLNFVTTTTNAVVISDQTTETNITLKLNPAEVTGQVLNSSTGTPINGALITITDLNGIAVGSGATDLNGNFTVLNLPPATLNISAVAGGFGSDSKSVILTPGEIEATTLSLTPTPGTVTGTVLNAQSGDPLAGATVQIFDFTRALVATLQTNQSGVYQYQNLAPGSYRLIATANNFGAVTQDTQVTSEATTTLNFNLTPSPGTITGSVFNQQTGAPIAGASIAIRQFSPFGPIVATIATNIQGQFTVFNLTPGAYTAVASEPNFGTESASTFVQSNSVSTVLLNLSPDPGIAQGTITSAQTGQTLADTLLRILDVNGVLVAVSQTDISGNYRIQGLAPGTFTIVATNPQFQQLANGITIASNQTVTQNISLQPNPGTITGTVVNAQTGTPLSGAVLQVFQSGSTTPVANTVTDQNGSFSLIGLAPGEYSLVSQATGFGSVAVGTVVTSGNTITITVQAPPFPGVISGRVTDFSGNALSNATVRLLDSNQNVVGIGSADLTGNYTIGNITAGTYTIIASASGFATNTQGVTIAPDQVLSNFNIPLEENPGTITGQVTSSGTGAPIPGAIVTIRSLQQGSGGIVVGTVNTDQQGTYLVKNLAPGEYSVTVTKMGFGTQIQTVTAASDQTSTASFALLADAGTLSGFVTDINGNPITGSNIFLRIFTDDNVLLKSVTAQPDGTFGVFGLDPGTYTVIAEAPNYAANSIPITITANQTTTVAIALTPNPATISGNVVNQQTNTPLQGVTVTASSNGQIIATAVTDINGNFQLTNLAAGSISIVTFAQNFVNTPQTIVLSPGETQQIILSLTPLTGTITGTVINQQTGAPVQGASVEIRQFSPAGPIAATTVTDGLGVFTISDLQPASYTIIAQATNFGTQAATTTVLPNDVSTISIGLTLLPGTVQGTVRNENTSAPLEEAIVRVIRRDGTVVDEVLTNAQGLFTIGGLPADSYTLVTISSGFQRQTIGFTVAPEQTTTVDVNLQLNPGKLTGTVTDFFSGGPIANAVVLVFPSQSITSIARGITNENGQYTILNLAPGEYNIIAVATDFARGGVGAVISAGSPTVANIQLTSNPATISGTVTDSGGNVIPNATVRVLDQNETVLGTAITDINGNYSVGNLPQGTLTIIASAQGFATQLTAVTLTPAQTLPNVDIQLTALVGSITGRVFNLATGQSIVGAITVVRTSGGTTVIVDSGTTDQNGRYLIEGLAPGSYSVVATASGFGTTTVGALVQANDATTADLVLSPLTGTVFGTVTNVNGSGITGSNIQVQVFTATGTLLKTLLANADGSFNVIDLAPGTYLIQVTAPNYATGVASVNVRANTTTSVSVPLTPNPATVTGQVVNSVTSAPLTGVIISVTDANGIVVGNAISDLNGQFIIRNLPPNTIIVTATATQPGFGSASTSVPLGPGANGNILLSLAPQAGLVTGAVRNAQTADLLQGATIQIFDFTRGLVATVVTDQNGQYRADNLAPGTYRIIASTQNFGSLVQETDVAVNEVTTLNFNLSPNPGSVEGTVFNQQTGEPLGNVSIVVRQFSPAGPVIANSSTNGNGTFTIPHLPPGTYTVIATLSTFGTQSASTQVFSNETAAVQLSLPPNPGAAQGFVTNAETGEPLFNTLVRIVDTDNVVVGTVQTDINGRYSIQNISPGTYTLIIINPDFQRQTVGCAIKSGQTTTINVSLQSNPGSIVGIVTSAQTGLPLVGATVQIFPYQGLISIGNTVTDENGRYRFISIQPGSYTVSANATNFARTSSGASVLATTQSTVNLSLQSNPASMSGQIVDQDGNPISNASIRVIDQSETVLGTGISGSDGRYTVQGLPPGNRNIVVSAAGFSTATSGITLLLGESRLDVNFTLVANPGILTGTVIDANTNAPLVGVNVVVRNLLGIIVSSGFSNVDGRYTIQNLTPGQYTVSFFDESYDTVILGAQITSNTTTILNATLTRASGAGTNGKPSIRGQIVDEQGVPITTPFIPVKILDANLVVVQILLALSNGRFEVFDLAPGTYLVNAEASDFASNTVSAIVRNNETTEVVVTLTPLPGTLTGQVINSVSGEVIVGASITVTRSNGVIIATGISGDNGFFTIPNLPAGPLNIIAQAIGFGNATTSAIITNGETTTTTLSLSPSPGRLIGQVTSASSGLPLQGATVQLFDENRTFILSIVADSQGNFKVPTLSPGKYVAVASSFGFGSELRGFTIIANQDIIIAFDLAPNPGIIRGQVVTSEAGQPIPNASVVIRALTPSGPILATTVTDSNGFYEVTGIVSGTYTVVFSGAPLFGSDISSVQLDAGEIEIVNASLSSFISTVQGRVVDEEGNGLANALVQLFNTQSGLIRRVQTDNDGNYFIRGFTAGSYTLTANQPNFQAALTRFEAAPNEVATINFTLLADPGIISGTIRDVVTNQPVPGAVVNLFPNQSLSPIAFAVTDQLGNYQFPGLQPGSYVVVGSEFNYASASAGATVTSNQVTIANLFLQPNFASISGTVSTLEGLPINNATVRILNQNQVIIGYGITNENGFYAIGNIPVGTFTVIASAPAFQSVLSDLTLAQGDQQKNIDFVLQSNPGILTGTVTNQSNEPIPGAFVNVRLLGATGIIIASTVTDSNGRYVITDLPPGSYTVSATASGFETKAVGAIIETNATEVVDIMLTGVFGSINGVVLNNLAQPIVGSSISLSLFDTNNLLIFTTTGYSDGTFSFPNLEPGNYFITASASGFITEVIGARVTANEATFARILLQSSPATVTGQVVTLAGGQAIQGAIVSATTLEGQVLAVTATDVSGRFTIMNLPPGALIVTATAVNFGADSKTVLLQTNGITSTTLFLSMAPGFLTGTVKSEAENPIPNTVVQLFDFTNGLVATAVTNAIGQYTIQGLNPGNYRVVFTAEEFERLSAGATINSGETTSLNVKLSSLFATIKGSVLNAQTKSPIQGAAVTIRYQSSSGPIFTTVFTDTSGKFTISSIPDGAFSIIATAAGFGSQGLTAFAVGGQTFTFNLLLLPQVGTIRGKVTDSSSGAPLANTRIRVINASGVVVTTTQTDINGNYLLSNLAAGTYQIITSNVDYQAAAQTVTLTTNEVKEVDFTLNGNPARLIGRVVDKETKFPVIGALIEVFNEVDLSVSFGLTDENGKYVIEGLPQGAFSVRASASGYMSETVKIQLSPNEVLELNFALTTTAAFTGAIIGQVVDNSTSLPIANARVNLLDNEGQLIASTTTNEAGQYFFASLEAKTYTVVVDADGYQTQQQSVTIAILFEQGEAIVANFRLDPIELGATITGKVINAETKQPIFGATIQIINIKNQIVGRATTDQLGRFTIHDILPGTYTIFVTTIGFIPADPQQIKVNSGEVLDLQTFELKQIPSSTGAITGRVVDNSTSVPIANVRINLLDNQGQLAASTTTNEAGEYSFISLKAGTYTVVVDTDGYQAIPPSVTITIRQGETQRADFRLDPIELGATITGKVINAETKQPIFGATIHVINTKDQIVGRATTDRLGRFTIHDIPPGTYTILVTAIGFIPADPQQITVNSGEVLELQTFELKPKNPVPSFNPCDLINPVVTCNVCEVSCREQPPGRRRTIQVQLQDGTYQTLHLIHLVKIITVVIRITGKNGSYISEPYQITSYERIALEVPSNAKVRCDITVSDCFAQLIYLQNQPASILFSFDLNQQFLSERDVVVTIKGKQIRPRCENGVAGEWEEYKEVENFTLKVSEILDWIKTHTKKEIQIKLNQFNFTSESNTD
ncbi:carboxypeptidase regulatory-like domain-containing protein [Priestia aryabhattai]